MAQINANEHLSAVSFAAKSLLHFLPWRRGSKRYLGYVQPLQECVFSCLFAPTEREGHCCWMVASRSYCGAFDMSASARGKLHLQVYRMWCLRTDWHTEPGRAPSRVLTGGKNQQQPCVCQCLEVITSFLAKPPNPESEMFTSPSLEMSQAGTGTGGLCNFLVTPLVNT